MQASSLDPAKVRRQALKRYSLKAIAPEYERWFDQITTLWDEGWYQMPKELVTA